MENEFAHMEQRLNQAIDIIQQALSIIDSVGEDLFALRRIHKEKASTSEKTSTSENLEKSEVTSEERMKNLETTSENKAIPDQAAQEEEIDEKEAELISKRFAEVSHKILSQTHKVLPKTPSISNMEIDIKSYFDEYYRVSQIAFNIRNSDKCHTIHGGFYPKLIMLPGVNPKVIAEMFKYGYVQTIYPSTNLQELVYLPTEIREACRQFKDGTKTTSDIYLQIISAPPDWEGENYFSGQHLVQIGISKPRPFQKNQFYIKFPEQMDKNYIERRRTAGLKALYDRFLQHLSNRNVWTYQFSSYISVVSIGNKMMTMGSISKLRNEASRIFKNKIASSTSARSQLCKLLKHDEKDCGSCYTKDSNIKAEDEDNEAIILL
ncbi:hypothetical protein J5N97_023392 [Dioscorea zingiberensis]|uniref:Uncharacterized protein n=1 Tax=Dioscorea zingiberensis TaxID=325984 RepID=A0A9D5HBT7_9LILI|nr:hypothetical protein J5N97_023392 [Dioscorea zingiberensis]